MPKISQKNIFLISGITCFLVIATLFAFYFNSQNSANNSKIDIQNAQNSQNSLSNSSLAFSNSISGSVSNANSSQTSAFTNSSTSLISQFSNNSQNNSTIPVPVLSNLENNQNINPQVNSQTNSAQNTQNPVQNQTQTLPNNSSNVQTYTNPNYPNLKINYDNSWKIERKNSKVVDFENPNGQLMDGVLTLKKNNTTLSFNFGIPRRYGGGGMDNKVLADLGKFKRYNEFIPAINYEAGLQKDRYIYSKETGDKMMSDIQTNLTKSDLTAAEIKSLIPDSFVDNKLKFWVFIGLWSTNPAEIAEADEIIKNSILE